MSREDYLKIRLNVDDYVERYKRAIECNMNLEHEAITEYELVIDKIKLVQRKGKQVIMVRVPPEEEWEWEKSMGQFVFFVMNGKSFCEGVVVHCEIMDIFISPLRPLDSLTMTNLKTRTVTMHKKFNPVPFDRALEGLRRIPEMIMGNTQLVKIITDDKSKAPTVDPEQNVEDFCKLDRKFNMKQKRAICMTKECDVTLIQGPPGTGKTVLASAIASYHLEHLGAKRILISAHSNIVVQLLTERCVREKLKVVQYVSQNYQENIFHPNTFHSIRNRYIRKNPSSPLAKAWKVSGENKANFNTFRELEDIFAQKVLSEAQVVCATCSMCGSQNIRNLKFDLVIIDEVTQSSEPDSLLPLLLSTKKCVLMGDHRQLGPVVKYDEPLLDILKVSIFERLQGRVPEVMLEKQYRMHPEISEFPNMCFYNNQLVDGHPLSHFKNVAMEWPFKGKTFFINVEGQAKKYRESWLNELEVAKIVEYILEFVRVGIDMSKVGIITPYRAQKGLIKRYIHSLVHNRHINRKVENIQINTVDGFQGKEKDYIMISTVRIGASVGFIDDPRRMNVALTRAKYGQIVFGNMPTLVKTENWKKFGKFYNNKSIIY